MTISSPYHSEPLNPVLFRALERQFHRVRIANEGESQVAIAGLGGRRQIINSGEYYRVNCPYCNDTRDRLWINHMFGQPNSRGFPDTSLVTCFNEDCFGERPTRRNELFDRIFGLRNRNQRHPQMPIRLGTVSLAIGPAQPPGHLIPLDQLPESHPALRYIIDRGFSPLSLQHEYGVAYCEHALMPYGMASNRLYIPIHRNGVLVGWQCRYLGTPESGAPPKYFSMRGMPKNQLLYNFDNAKDSALVVVCEGPTDVWRIGRPAVAIFGKTLSQAQKLLLETHWPHRPIVLMLDGEAASDMARIKSELLARGRNPVVSVDLPSGCDPGSLSTEAAWQLIHAAAVRDRIALTV